MYKFPREYPFSTEVWYMHDNSMQYLTEHFQVWEFASHDGADEVIICPELLLHCLEPLFVETDAATIKVISGYRTISQSLKAKSSGATDNHHLGMAADIAIKSKKTGKWLASIEIARAAQKIGWNRGIGLMKGTSIHLDSGSMYWFDETRKDARGKLIKVSDWNTYR